MKKFLVAFVSFLAFESINESLNNSKVAAQCANGNCPTVYYNGRTYQTIPQNYQLVQPASVPIQSVQPVQSSNIAWRNPVGHTHTCSNCGLPWDHQNNPTHNCKDCGASQYYVDSRPKLVPVNGTLKNRPVQSVNTPVQPTNIITPVTPTTPQIIPADKINPPSPVALHWVL